MPIPEAFIQEVISRSDIEDVVSDYVRLTKRSGSNHFGLCPFHGEKTPSFSVSREKQIFHCFGCGKGGGVITFIMEIENLNYPEAIEFLAHRAGMEVPQESRDPSAKKRERMLALNKDAARYYVSVLHSPAGRPAQQYIDKRGLDRKTVTTFGLGYAPDTWSGLRDAMREKGYSDKEMFEAGLLRHKDDRFYDVFRNRLMFPVVDVKKNVIGFSGRIIGDGEPKYMNSPETLVFNKGRNLFALNLAKNSKRGYIILSEGNIDVASLHQAGFDCAVASLGTSLTAEQAQMISRYTKEVVIAYDNDAAGAKASDRAIQILEKLDLKVKVLRLTDAKDPDEYIKAFGAGPFDAMIRGSEDQMDYRLRLITEKYDLTVPDKKVACVEEAARLLASLPGAVEREVYSRRIAQIAGVSDNVVISDVERLRKSMLRKASPDNAKRVSATAAVQPGERDLRYQNPASALAEETIIGLLYRDHGLASQVKLPSPDEFSSPALSHIYAAMLDRINSGAPIDENSLAPDLTGGEMSLFISVIAKPVSDTNRDRALADCISKMRQEKLGSDAKNDLAAMLAQKRAQQKK